MYDCWFLGNFVCISISLQTSLHTRQVENNEKHKFMLIHKFEKSKIELLVMTIEHTSAKTQA